MPRHTSFAASILGAGLLALTLAACSDPPRSPTPAKNGVTLGPTTNSSTPAVFGGAPVLVTPGSPAVCNILASSAAIRDIPRAIAAMADPGTEAGGANRLRAAAADLHAAAAGVDLPVAAGLLATSNNLERLADAGLADGAAANTAAVSLSELGRQVQDLCQYPIGSP